MRRERELIAAAAPDDRLSGKRVFIGEPGDHSPPVVQRGGRHAEWPEDALAKKLLVRPPAGALDDDPEEEIALIAVLPVCSRRKVQRRVRRGVEHLLLV